VGRKGEGRKEGRQGERKEERVGDTVLESLTVAQQIDKVVTSESFERREQVVIAITVKNKTNGSNTCNTVLESLTAAQQIDKVV
jgi:hypothetical protein